MFCVHRDEQLRETRFKPIVIPAIDSRLGSPFMRAYPPELDRFGISEETFLSFLDQLNHVMKPNQVVEAVGIAGGAVTLVPEPVAMITGNAISVSADIAVEQVSRFCTAMLLRTANRDSFGPHGLVARIARLDTVAEIAGIPILDKDHKVADDLRFLPRYETNQDLGLQTPHARRLKALEQWISPLSIAQRHVSDLPDHQLGKLSRMNAALSDWEMKHDERKLLKSRVKGRSKLLEKQQSAKVRYEKEEKKLIEIQSKIELDCMRGRNTEDHEQELKERCDKLQIQHEKRLKQIEKESTKEDKEERCIRKIYFLLITQLNSRGYSS